LYVTLPMLVKTTVKGRIGLYPTCQKSIVPISTSKNDSYYNLRHVGKQGKPNDLLVVMKRFLLNYYQLDYLVCLISFAFRPPLTELWANHYNWETQRKMSGKWICKIIGSNATAATRFPSNRRKLTLKQVAFRQRSLQARCLPFIKRKTIPCFRFHA